MANYDRKRRSEKEARSGDARRDRSANANRPGNGISQQQQQQQAPAHVARVSASVQAVPMRKLSEPLLNGRPEDLDMLANELTRIGRTQLHMNGSNMSPPPPAPPPRDASINSMISGGSMVSGGGDDLTSPHDGTTLASETVLAPSASIRQSVSNGEMAQWIKSTLRSDRLGFDSTSVHNQDHRMTIPQEVIVGVKFVPNEFRNKLFSFG